MLMMQVNQADLKYVHPAAREAAGGARAALGAEYELQLRSEAGPAPAKLAKRKHQISSLYHHAKIRVGEYACRVMSCICYGFGKFCIEFNPFCRRLTLH